MTPSSMSASFVTARARVRDAMERVLPTSVARWIGAAYYSSWALRPRALRREPDLELALALVRPGEIVVDGGANVGRYAVPFARAVGEKGRVYAVEPVERTALLLRAILRLRRTRNVEVVQMALSDVTGRSAMAIPLAAGGAGRNFYRASLDRRAPGDAIVAVDSITIDVLLGSQDPPSLVKLDLEGHELAALKGSENVLMSRPALLLEWPSGPQSPPSEPELEQLLTGLGYAIYRYEPRCRRIVPLRDGDRPLNIWALTDDHISRLLGMEIDA